MKYTVELNGHEFEIELSQSNGVFEGSCNHKEPQKVDLVDIDGDLKSAIVGNRSLEVEIVTSGRDCWIYHRGNVYRFSIKDKKKGLLSKAVQTISSQLTNKELSAPMPGIVVSIGAKVRQAVKKGEGLLVIEAMKMENEIKAPFDGEIKAINVQVGQNVDVGSVLVTFV